MKKSLLAIFIALSSWSCMALSLPYRLGTEAEMNKKWDEAIKYYERASLEHPTEPVYRLALERAKISSSLSHLQEARRLAAAGMKDEGKAEYAKAQALNPRDSAISREAEAATSEVAKEAQAKNEKIEFPIKLKTKEESVKLTFPVETGLKSIFLALGKTTGLSFIFDEQFRDTPFSIDLTNMGVEQALRSICLASKNFYRIIDERTVIIVPDNPMKRMQYEANCIKTFYLSNVVAQDMLGSLSQMLRSTTKPTTIIFDKNLNSITIRDTPQVVELAERLIRVWDKPKAEVVVDLEIMEVSRTRLRQLGISFSQDNVGIQYGTPTSSTSGGTTTTTSSGWFNLSGIDFTKTGNYSVNLPLAYLQLLESDSDTKLLAQPRLRGVSDEEMRHLVGQKIPIPMTTFSPIAAGGVSTQPITSYQQQDVGLEVKIKPTVHFEKEVTLSVEIKVTSLGGTGYADIPIINNREIKNVLRLKDGETNLIGGLLRDEERNAVKGIPALKDIPLLGRLFGAEDKSREQTEVILTITPYIVRSIPLSTEDEKALWVDVETPSGGSQGEMEADVMERPLNALDAERAQMRRRVQEPAAANQVSILPPSIELRSEQEFRLAVNLRTENEIGNMSVVLSYDSRLLTLKDVAEGGLTRLLGEKTPFLKNIDNGSGTCTIGFSSPVIGKGFKGGGALATLVFQTKASGECTVSVSSVSAIGSNGQPLMLQSSSSRVIIR